MIRLRHWMAGWTGWKFIKDLLHNRRFLDGTRLRSSLLVHLPFNGIDNAQVGNEVLASHLQLFFETGFANKVTHEGIGLSPFGAFGLALIVLVATTIQEGIDARANGQEETSKHESQGI